MEVQFSYCFAELGSTMYYLDFILLVGVCCVTFSMVIHVCFVFMSHRCRLEGGLIASAYREVTQTHIKDLR